MTKLTVANGAVCLSIASSTIENALQVAKANQSLCDVIEIRLDTIKGAGAADFIGQLDKPLLFTNRYKKEGGQFS